MNCPNCGKEINDNENFCSNCGTKIIKKEEIEKKQEAKTETNASTTNNTANNKEIDEVDRKKGNRLCIASAISLIITPWLLVIFHNPTTIGYYGNDFLASLYSTVHGLLSIYGLLSYLVGLVLMIVARVKYPKNKAAKILMWIYIGVSILSVLTTLLLCACQIWIYQNCSGCN